MSIKFAPTSFSPYFSPNSAAFQCLLLSKVSLLRSGASSGIVRGFVDGSWNKRKARSLSIYSGRELHVRNATYCICAHPMRDEDPVVCTVLSTVVSSTPQN